MIFITSFDFFSDNANKTNVYEKSLADIREENNVLENRINSMAAENQKYRDRSDREIEELTYQLKGILNEMRGCAV